MEPAPGLAGGARPPAGNIGTHLGGSAALAGESQRFRAAAPLRRAVAHHLCQPAVYEPITVRWWRAGSDNWLPHARRVEFRGGLAFAASGRGADALWRGAPRPTARG